MKKTVAIILSLIFVFFVLVGSLVIKTKANSSSSSNGNVKYFSIANNQHNLNEPKKNPSDKKNTNLNENKSMNLNENKSVNLDEKTNVSKVASLKKSNVESTNKISTSNTYKTNKIKNSRGIDNINSNTNKTYYAHKVVVLTYHHISNQAFSGITITPDRFEADLKMLREKGFKVISFKDMLQGIEGKYDIPDNAVVITFDDGISSVYKYAFPLLKKYNAPATSFIITSRNQSYKQFTASDNPLSPSEITEMYQSGLVDFQSHSHQSHEYVYINSQLKKGAKLTNQIYNKYSKTYESHEVYVKRVLEDLTKSRELIFKFTGSDADALCFPFGIYDKELIELAQKCGFKYFVTTQNGVNEQDSKKNKIYRIRAGDAELDSVKLYYSILGSSK